ncbi:exported hypothetical protein [Microbacterium sp. C448]|uniref:hypothetical protein n=1 Tax=Microbacterium sp. C448 TaxID=1177594 RepID=UPI0003DE355E|nr:hypothetical protein [Microbacterium sp. C448]CDK00895.1 exported hypothetical protein [Microbacterium sp. C448]
MRRRYELPSMRAITALGLGATIATLSATTLMHLVQGVLHYGCEFLIGGEAGTGSWVCSDGIGYLLPGISLVVPIFLAAVLGTVVTFALYAFGASNCARTQRGGAAGMGVRVDPLSGPVVRR